MTTAARPTPVWVWAAAGVIGLVGVVVAIVIFAQHGDAGTTPAQPTSSASLTTAAAPSSAEGKPSLADLKAGMVQILTADGKLTDVQVEKLADCAAPLFLDQMQAQSLQNLAAGQDRLTPGDESIAKKIVNDCSGSTPSAGA